MTTIEDRAAPAATAPTPTTVAAPARPRPARPALLLGAFVALGQLVLGPLSDALGRRRPLLAGTALHVLASPLLRRWPPQQVLAAGTVAGAAGGAALVAVAAAGIGGLPGVVELLWAVLFACGLALPNAPALALSEHADVAGTATALLGAIPFGVGALVSPVLGLLGNDVGAIGAVVVTSLGLAIVVLVTVVRAWQLAAPDEPAGAVALH